MDHQPEFEKEESNELHSNRSNEIENRQEIDQARGTTEDVNGQLQEHIQVEDHHNQLLEEQDESKEEKNEEKEREGGKEIKEEEKEKGEEEENVDEEGSKQDDKVVVEEENKEEIIRQHVENTDCPLKSTIDDSKREIENLQTELEKKNKDLEQTKKELDESTKKVTKSQQDLKEYINLSEKRLKEAQDLENKALIELEKISKEEKEKKEQMIKQSESSIEELLQKDKESMEKISLLEKQIEHLQSTSNSLTTYLIRSHTNLRSLVNILKSFPKSIINEKEYRKVEKAVRDGENLSEAISKSKEIHHNLGKLPQSLIDELKKVEMGHQEFTLREEKPRQISTGLISVGLIVPTLVGSYLFLQRRW